MSVVAGSDPETEVRAQRAGGWRRLTGSRAATYGLVVAVTVVLWQLLSLMIPPLFLPGPARVVGAAVETIADGELFEHIGWSYWRVLSGWVIGAVMAVPLGLVAGRLRPVRIAVEPYLNFFRFVPPIAFISLALIWLGIGETSKIALIVYASLFIVFLNTVAAAQGVDEEKVRAAQCLGASRLQTLTTVVIPASVPGVVTGLRAAMGNCFMTVVAAELVAASEGVGWLIYNSRLFARTDLVFVGIVTLGVMGFVADFVFRTLVSRLAYRYEIKF